MKNKVFSILLLLISNMIWASVTLPNVISDNMILQRNSKVTLWGWADPNEEIKIRAGWDNQEFTSKASNMATWCIEIPTPQAGGPYTIAIKGYNEIVLKNILIGEVWLCSGQSNMEMSASWGIDNGDEETNLANFPNIRFFQIPKLTALTPQDNVQASWKACTPETMKYASAVAYFFARRLQEDLKDVPIGLIISAWGGTPAEVWIPEPTINSNPELLTAANRNKEQKWGPHKPGHTFNAMIAPITNFKIAGALWYQGESNVGSEIYNKTLAALIGSWRTLWKQEFPFYYVQIAPYDYGEDHFSGSIVRDSQRRVQNEVANTAMVVISDVSPTDDIHPKDKKSVGRRLANIALAKTYNVYSAQVQGPTFKTVTYIKGKAVISFDSAGGMYFKNKTSKLFEVAGSDGIFYPAKAAIKGDSIIIEASQVKKPVHVRYAWNNSDKADLFNNTGLPASSFNE